MWLQGGGGGGVQGSGAAASSSFSCKVGPSENGFEVTSSQPQTLPNLSIYCLLFRLAVFRVVLLLWSKLSQTLGPGPTNNNCNTNKRKKGRGPMMLEVGPAYSDSFSKTNVCDDMQTELMWRWALLEKDSEPSTLCGRGACHTIGTEFIIMLHCAVMSF
jgi:hypothetical protein